MKYILPIAIYFPSIGTQLICTFVWKNFYSIFQFSVFLYRVVLFLLVFFYEFVLWVKVANFTSEFMYVTYILKNKFLPKTSQNHPKTHENKVVCVYFQSVSAFGSKVLPVIANCQEINASMQSKADQTRQTTNKTDKFSNININKLG